MTVGFLFCVFIVFYFAFLEGGYFHKGQHRGEYVEKPEWRAPVETEWASPPWTQLSNGTLLWDDNITISNVVPRGSLTIPALLGPPGPPDVPGEEEIREYINHELCSTPIFTGLKYGGFGDSDFDRADSAPLCITAKTWFPGDDK